MTILSYLMLIGALAVATFSTLGLIALLDFCFEYAKSGPVQERPPLSQRRETTAEAPDVSKAVTGGARICDWATDWDEVA